ncbi:MAG: transglycosylase SLT domain-containing protein, partial [Bryobacteraceae bacterium]
NYSSLCTCLVVLAFLNGCASSGPKFKNTFLPPARKVPAPIVPLSAAPALKSHPLLSETPKPIKPGLKLPPKPTSADFRAQRAEEMFRLGREHYERGDMEGARREFDNAVDHLLSAPEDLPDRYKVEAKLETLVAAIHRYDVNGLGSGDLSSQPEYDKAPLDDILEITFPVDPNLRPKANEQLNATTSQIPLVVNDTVLSYINYFSSPSGRRTMLAGLKRSGRYKPLISRILAEEGVPQELIYLAQAESGFLPRAVSDKTATGMWQFMRARGREYGLSQTAYTDDRLDPAKATRSAARHLKDLYEKFGDWYLAIAAYNCGDGCVERAVERTGYADFWELRRLNAIPRETTNYVPIVLAMTLMLKNAEDYDLVDVEFDDPLEYEVLELTATTHLALIADLAGQPMPEIRELNPALLRNVAPAGYRLRIPEGTITSVLAGLDTIPPSRRASWRAHRVAEGDTLASIAKRYRTAASRIKAANEVATIEPGDVLAIPTAPEQPKRNAKPRKTGSASSGKPAKKVSSARPAQSKDAANRTETARLR